MVLVGWNLEEATSLVRQIAELRARGFSLTNAQAATYVETEVMNGYNEWTIENEAEIADPEANSEFLTAFVNSEIGTDGTKVWVSHSDGTVTYQNP